MYCFADIVIQAPLEGLVFILLFIFLMIKGFRQIALLTIISRILGMVRDMTFAFFLGATGLMDGWVIAFKIPNLARRIFGEGAASSSFIPVYTAELNRDSGSASRLAGTVLTFIIIILTAIVILGELFIITYYKYFSSYETGKLTLILAGIMLPYMVLICAVAILAGVLNSHRHFAAPAAAPIVLNIFIISSLFFAAYVLDFAPSAMLLFTAFAVITAGLCQISLQLLAARSLNIHIKPNFKFDTEPFKKVILLMAPMIIGLTVTQINTLADDYIALFLSATQSKGDTFTFLSKTISYPVREGAVSHLFYAQRLYQMPLGVLGISLATAVFPVMSSNAASGDLKALAKTISRGLRCVIYIALPATVGLLIVRTPLVALLFERGRFAQDDTRLTSFTLIFYALGLTGFFAQQIITRAFYSLGNSKLPAVTACIAVAVNIVMNLLLIFPLGTAGLALSTALCSYLQIAIMIAVMYRKLDPAMVEQIPSATVKTLVATVLMALAGWTVFWLMAPLGGDTLGNLLRILVIVPLCAAVYIGLSVLLKIKMLSLITGGIGNKPKTNEENDN